MNDPWIINPLQNPIFEPVLLRTLLLFIAGFLLVLVLNKGYKGLWETNVGKRYLSWLVIGPIYLAAILFGGWTALAFLLLVLYLGLHEIAAMSKIQRSYIIMLGVLALVTVYVASQHPRYFYTLPILYFMLLSSVAIGENDKRKSLYDMSFSLFVAIWLVFSLAHFVLLGHLNNQLDSTKALLLLIGFAVPLSDIFAYVIGRWFQKIGFLDQYKIASNLSPNKTYIGTLGNIFGAALGVGIMYFALKEYLPWYHWVILALIIGVMDVMGDITKSMIKRHYGVKDSGRLIPGHGGILDRIDSTLRVIVVVYYYLLIFL